MTLRTSQGRFPRGIVKINGTPVSFLSATVENKSHFASDTWRVRLEAWNQPEGFGMKFWGDEVNAQVEILFGFQMPGADISSGASSPTSIILGQVDDVEIDPLDSESLIISGRDLSAQLIDNKTTNKYPDHVSSWIATSIAKQFGLIPQVTTTTQKVGQYYNNAYSTIGRDVTYWDLLVYLAEQEDFDLYVLGNTLYFGPPQADGDTNPLIVTITGGNGAIVQSNALKLRLRRSLTIAKDITVTVLSHGVASGKAIKAVAHRAGKGGSSSGALNYKYTKPNMTLQQAQNFANSKLANITKFERTIEVNMEGDPLMTVRRKIVLQGTQTSFDQSYYVQTICRTLDFEGGFSMSLHGKNTSTESVPAQ
jgi:hypothetical protein